MVCKYHILFIHPCIKGHLGCFHPGVIWTVLLWKWVCRLFFFWSSWFELFGVIYSDVGLLDHTIVLFWIWGKPHVVFHSFHGFSSPPAAQKGYDFSGLLLWKKRGPWLAGAICCRCNKRSRTHVGCEAPDLRACLLLHCSRRPHQLPAQQQKPAPSSTSCRLMETGT